MELFPWFAEFWHWAEKQAFSDKQQHLLLARIGEYWQDWFEDESATHRTEINNLRNNTWAHRAFVSDLKEWARVKWPDHCQTAAWLLFALVREQPFDQWSGLVRYQKPDGLDGVFGIYLHRPEGGRAEDVRRTRCLLVPNLNPEPARPTHYADSHQPLLDRAAGRTPKRALGAMMNLLTGPAFWWSFLKWALFGEKQVWKRHRVLRWADWALRWPSLLLSMVMFGFLALTDPWEYFADDTVLVPVALAFVILSLLMMVARIVPVFREWRRVKRQRRQWADFLRRSCACIIIGEGEELDIFGPSFGLALFFSILVTLDGNSPAQSQLVLQLITRLKDISDSLAFTGDIRADGRIRKVWRLKDKIEAARACGFLRHFITPVQDEVQREGQNLPLALGKVYAAGESLPHVQSYEEVIPLMQGIGEFRQRAPFGMMVAAMLLWVCMAVSASFTLFGLTQWAVAPPDPTLLLKLTKLTGETLSLVLEIESQDPTRFAGRLSSHYWAHRPAEPFSPKQNAPFLGALMIQSEKVDDATGSEDDVMIELICPRRFLWRELPPAIIEARSLGDLRNSNPSEEVR